MTDRPRPPSLADLLAAEREVAPEPAAEARVWAGVEHRLVHGPPPPSLPGPGAGLLVKWVGGIVLGAALVGGAALWPTRAPPEPVPAPPVTAPAALQPVPEDMSLPPLPISQPGPAAPTPEPPAAPVAAVPGPRKRPAGPAPGEVLDLGAELRLIASIRAALQRGDTAAALAGISEHKHKFGSAGALVQERSAHEVEAVCAAGRRAQARRLADQFLARWPDSPQRARVSTSCVDE